MQVGCAWAVAATVVVMVTVGPEVTVRQMGALAMAALPSARGAAVAGAAAVLLGVQAVGVVAEMSWVSCYCRAACVAAGAHRLRQIGLESAGRQKDHTKSEALGDFTSILPPLLSSKTCADCLVQQNVTRICVR